MTLKKQPNPYFPAFVVTVCIFFFWGFAASGNALLIPVLKAKFALSQFQSQLVELSFYLAYFIGSLSYFFVSMKKPDWLEKFSSKKVMVSGLVISAIGTVCLVLAAESEYYIFLLLSLFIIAFGFALQQIIANPLLIKLGGEHYGAHRLILAGAINSFGNTIAPLVLSFFIFGAVSSVNSQLSLVAVQPLFICIAALYLILAFCFYRLKLPETIAVERGKINGIGALKYPQLVLGMVAIFCYVGSEVALQSNLPALVASKQVMNLPAKDAIHYFSLFGGSLMVGRWTGAIFNFKLSRQKTTILMFLVPLLAFSVVLFANWIKGSNLFELIDYAPFLLVLMLALLISGNKPQKMLLFSAGTSIVLIFASFLFPGKPAMYCIIAVANFSSLMWSCIFMLSIKGLGNYTQQGASLLVMMILGGAIIPPLQGLLSDQAVIGIHASFLLPVFCLSYIFWFAFKINTHYKK